MRTEKRCSRCRMTKRLEEFYRQSQRSADGHTAYCKVCTKEAVAEWQRRNRDLSPADLGWALPSAIEREREALTAIALLGKVA